MAVPFDPKVKSTDFASVVRDEFIGKSTLGRYPTNLTQLEVFRALRNSCTWEQVNDDGELPDFFGYQYFPDTETWRNNTAAYKSLRGGKAGKTLRGVDIEHNLCERTPEDMPGYTWSIFRVGPFVSRGGYDWHDGFGDNLGNLDRHTKDGPIFVNAYHIAPVLEDGTSLSLPPIHPHHLHFYPGTPSRCAQVKQYHLPSGGDSQLCFCTVLLSTL
eukprot:8884330-Pyramimonas_sp.AAC.2